MTNHSAIVARMLAVGIFTGLLAGWANGQIIVGDGPYFVGLGDLPGGSFRSQALAISSDGTTVVGASSSALGEFNEAFLWRLDSGMIPLGDFEGGTYSSRAQAVSADGSVVVGLGRKGFGGNTSQGRAFRWTEAGGMQDLGTIVGPDHDGFSNAWGVNDDGSAVVGTAQSLSGFDAFHWTSADGMQSVGGFEARGVSGDGSVVVGFDAIPNSGGASEAYRWTRNTGNVPLGFLTVSGQGSSQAIGISPDGEFIVGWSSSNAAGVDNREAFLWTEDGGMVGLGSSLLTPNGFSSDALAVSNGGAVVVGRAQVLGDNEFRAMIWDPVNGARDLRTVLLDDLGLDVDDWQLLEATGVSADGTIITGNGFNPSGNLEAFVARIPAPGASALLLAGGLMLNKHRR